MTRRHLIRGMTMGAIFRPKYTGRDGVIRESAGELLERLVLFDEFRGAGIPHGARSLAWALTFRHPERTLRDREVQGSTAKIVKSLEAELGVRQRTG